MEFSEKLIALRKGRELTQEQLAEMLNVSRQSISKWESGQVIPIEFFIATAIVIVIWAKSSTNRQKS